MIIAERKFIISNSRQRIWELILKAALRFMPFERMKPISERSIQALLRVKIGFINLPLNVEVEIADISPPESLATVLKAKCMGGLVCLNQRSIFTLRPINEVKTEVDCKIVEEGMSVLFRIFLLWWVKRYARDTFNSIEARLREWA